MGTKKAFVFYETFYEQLNVLPVNLKLIFFDYICLYGLYGEEPDIEDGTLRAVWIPIRTAIDTAKDRRSKNRENGAKGGRPKTPPALPEKPEQAPAARTADGGTPKAARFAKPTAEEIRAYCEEKKYTVNAEQFISYYESNGWRIGKNPMKNWKAAVTTWERRNADIPQGRQAGAVWGKENEIPDGYLSLM